MYQAVSCYQAVSNQDYSDNNTKIHDHNTCLKHNIHHPIGKHVLAKNCVCFDIPKIVNDCPNSILDKINIHSLQGFSGYIIAHFLPSYQENSTIVDCYVCNN